jgi:acetyl-CoA C-acetyltransferase
VDPVYIVDAVRTPIGRFGGTLKDHTAAEMGRAVVTGLLARTRVSGASIDETIIGNARQAGGGPNVARQISVGADIPHEKPAWTVNQACGSGLKAIIEGARMIQSGEAHTIVAGGTESMSRLPFMLDQVRWGTKLGHIPVVDGMHRDGFFCPMANELMGETVERLVKLYAIPREEQDQFALSSQEKAAAAIAAGRFVDEILPIMLKGGNAFSADEHPRAQTTMAGLAKLPTVFSKEGTLTAGNSSGITDGAAAVLLMDKASLDRSGLTPLARIEGWAGAGVDPRTMGMGPVPATQALLKRLGIGIDAFDLVEVNEAFAAQVLSVDRELKMPRERVNVNGGAIALGHPIGCTGTRIVVTLLHEMKRRNAKRGLATLCISGGMGLALSVVRD